MVIQVQPERNEGRSRSPRMAQAARDAVEHRRQMQVLFRCMVVHLEKAAMLDIRADQSLNCVLAGILRERADEHRRHAGEVRAHLVAEGALRPRPPFTLRAVESL